MWKEGKREEEMEGTDEEKDRRGRERKRQRESVLVFADWLCAGSTPSVLGDPICSSAFAIASCLH